MKIVYPYLRVIGFILLAYFLLEYATKDGFVGTIENHPIIWVLLLVVFVLAIAVEVILAALKNILFRSLDEKGQERYFEAEKVRKEKDFEWVKKVYNKLKGSKPIEQEGEIVLDHNYDGIKELDNNLPPWWVYMFYITILFAVIYLVRFEVLGEYNQAEEYEEEMAQAQLEIEEYKRTAKDLVDASTVELLTDEADLSAGKTIYNTSCVACHKTDGGGGIGPNLTDENWILGGGIKNVFTTISEGGRSGKGMVPWKNELKPSEIAQVASYVLSFQGTTPAEPKAPEGEIWIDPDKLEEEVPVNEEENLEEQPNN